MSNKRPYNYIELWKRKEIIECSLTKKESIKKCAQRLGVKYITAKHIVKVYKRTGRIETKIMKRSQQVSSVDSQLDNQTCSESDIYNKYCMDASHYAINEQGYMPSCIDFSPAHSNSGVTQSTLDTSYLSYYDPNYCTVILPNTPDMQATMMSPIDILQKGIVLMPDHALPQMMTNSPCQGASRYLGDLVFTRSAEC